MERNITIVFQETGKRVNLEGTFATLKDVKDALLEQDINTNDMEFMEGISKTKMSEPDAQLPTNILYKGKHTNNLVFLVTRIGKKIASGSSARALLYASIRELNLQEDCKKAFGKNYTLVSNEDLEWLVNQKLITSAPKAEEELMVVEHCENEERHIAIEEIDSSVCQTMLSQGEILLEEYRKRIKDMVDAFYAVSQHMLHLTKCYEELNRSEAPDTTTFSEEEVNEILGL